MSIYQYNNTREILTDILINKYHDEYMTNTSNDLSSIKICKLSGKSVTLAAANVVANILKLFINLKEVDLSDIIAGRPEVEALEVLSIIADSIKDLPIEILNLSSNALGLKGINSFRNGLSNKTLKKLYLTNTGLDAAAINGIKNILLDDENKNTILTTLHIGRNCLSNEGAYGLVPIIKRSPELTELVVNGTRFQSDGCLEFATGLIGQYNFTTLDLSDNNFGAKINAVKALSNVIAKNKNLKILNLAATSLESDGTKLIAQAIQYSKCKLEHLDLSLNDFESGVSHIIADMLAEQTELKYLSLEENQIRNNGVKSIFEALEKLPVLETCVLSGCQLHVSALKHIESFLENSKSIESKLFKKLDLSNNQLPDEIIESISTKENVSILTNDNDPEVYDSNDEETIFDVEDETGIENLLDNLKF